MPSTSYLFASDKVMRIFSKKNFYVKLRNISTPQSEHNIPFEVWSNNKVTNESLKILITKGSLQKPIHISFAKTQNLQKSKYLVRVRECSVTSENLVEPVCRHLLQLLNSTFQPRYLKVLKEPLMM